MEEGHRAQGAPLTVFNKLNYPDKEACPSTRRECQGSFGAGKSKVRAGDTKASFLKAKVTFEKTRVFEGNFTFQ